MAYDRTAPRTVSHARYERLKRWSQRKPAIALMGEFSAGKSTLLNFLIEEDILPTQATATELPPVWFSHGERHAFWVDEAGISHPLDLAELQTVPATARFIRIFAECEILEHCDVIDTPGISDPNLAVESWRFAAGQANMVLWCTSANQAWRETERAAWVSLPERLREHSLLIVTRADKLLTDTDRDKVARRMARETAGLFGGTVFMATPDAVRAKAELAGGGESALWQASGAEALLDALAERFEAIYSRKTAMFDRYAATDAAAEPDVGSGEPEVEADAVHRFGQPEPSPETAYPDPMSEGATADETPADAEPEAAQEDDVPLVAAVATTPPYQLTRPILPEGYAPRSERSDAEGVEMLERLRGGLEAVTDPQEESQAPAVSDEGDAEDTLSALVSGAVAGAQAEAGEPVAQATEPQAQEDDAAGEAREDGAEVAPAATVPEQHVPPQVLVWREIVARSSHDPSPREMVAMIEELLRELYGDRDGAAPARPEAEDLGAHAPGLRRLA